MARSFKAPAEESPRSSIAWKAVVGRRRSEPGPNWKYIASVKYRSLSGSRDRRRYACSNAESLAGIGPLLLLRIAAPSLRHAIAKFESIATARLSRAIALR